MVARPAGMGGFIVAWAGQVVSMLGTSMTRFALIFWAYEQTRAGHVAGADGLLHVCAGDRDQPLRRGFMPVAKAVQVSLAGLLGVAAGLGAYLFRLVCDVEDLLPGHQEAEEPAA